MMAQTSAKQKWQQKLLFVKNALEQPDPFKADPAVRADVEGAKKWIADHRPDVVFEDREETMQCIERHAQKLWASGEVDRWFLGCDAGVRRVSRGVNGPLLDDLVEAADHCDHACPDMFRHGAPLFGELAISGVGVPLELEAPACGDIPVDSLTHNEEMLRGLVLDSCAEELWRSVMCVACPRIL